jgi:cellulose synthase/poly-beta-1,6-N-acetylglucosamine synthase-like glycosyltransferase
MSGWEIATLGLYLGVLAVLAVFGLHRYHLVLLHRRHRATCPEPAGQFDEEPCVTVQLPVFNERYVVERLIEAVCAFDWPRERLEIQVLDDSTDDTREIAAAAVARLRAAGHDIHHLHRTDRQGFKAGALEAGLAQARGEFIAIFDADFIPPPDLLRRTTDHFTDPAVGMIQVRWGHINADHSLLTRIQALMLDGHFVVEHTARHRSGCFFNFNGTAGIWRRACIDAAGGWQHDTLTEDLDLSYRAQIAGWRFVYLPAVTAPAELPVEMNAFKSQQHRWTKGSIQTGLKLLPTILRARLPLRVKAEAVFHLTDNCSYPLMLLLALLMGPTLFIRHVHGLDWIYIVDLPLFLAATMSVATFYVAAARDLSRRWGRRALLLPALMALGIGLSVNNARAVFEALLGRESPFVRTPKHRIEGQGRGRVHSRYRARPNVLPAAEIALGLWFVVITAHALVVGQWLALPFLVLFLSGFLLIGSLSLSQSLGLRHRLAWMAPSPGVLTAAGGRLPSGPPEPEIRNLARDLARPAVAVRSEK